MAEVIARSRVAELGWEHVEVRSAGVAAFPGSPASEGALRAAAKYGLDLSDHASQLLTEAKAREADLILTMSPMHLMRVIELGGGDRAALLTSYAGGTPDEPRADLVPDPIGGSDEEYEETFLLLRELVERMMSRLQSEASP